MDAIRKHNGLKDRDIGIRAALSYCINQHSCPWFMGQVICHFSSEEAAQMLSFKSLNACHRGK